MVRPKTSTSQFQRTGMDIGMAHAEPAGERLEAGVVHFVQIADRAVGDGADATQGAVDVAVHLAPKGSDDPRLVEILHDDDLRSRHAGDVAAVFAPGVGIPSRCSALLGSMTTVTA